MQDILDFISQSRQIPVLNQYMNYVVINKDDFSHNLSHYTSMAQLSKRSFHQPTALEVYFIYCAKLRGDPVPLYWKNYTIKSLLNRSKECWTPIPHSLITYYILYKMYKQGNASKLNLESLSNFYAKRIAAIHPSNW